MGKYLITSTFGALVGAALILGAVYLTNTRSLAIATSEYRISHSATEDNSKTDIHPLSANVHQLSDYINISEERFNLLHSRINDFYIFSGIVITLLLAINVGVFIRADSEIDRHMKENFEMHKKKLESMVFDSNKIINRMSLNFTLSEQLRDSINILKERTQTNKDT